MQATTIWSNSVSTTQPIHTLICPHLQAGSKFSLCISTIPRSIIGSTFSQSLFTSIASLGQCSSYIPPPLSTTTKQSQLSTPLMVLYPHSPATIKLLSDCQLKRDTMLLMEALRLFILLTP